MKKLKIYLETSVFGFMLGEQQTAERTSTEQLFQEIIGGNLEAYVSTEVVRELGKAPEPMRSTLLLLIPRYGLKELEVTAEARALALQHIVKTRTRLGVNGINKLLGYRELEIATPQEVIST
ncbi:MAG: hypothetical protein A3G35_09345 [candidate division NC10 bacterium RIFCSPLOWO2_12_FULL_66_18]|nr:MAG: hypothetical protein A3H39_11390 [candidate division NC10 bacterium RIFCSPLOWO2_02_FULL_66_22]OGB96447.1 MAG: hypothetical protein A3G35_09345 [candidate division NC10 bacterium RIFCSPLOWO2_12_FULL_66_18]